MREVRVTTAPWKFRQRLEVGGHALDIAEKCPVAKTLKGPIVVETTLA